MEPADQQVAAPMAGQSAAKGKRPHLVWVFSATIADRLDNATWLRTTDELRRLGWRVTLIGMGPAGIQHVNGVETLCIPRPDVYLLGNALFHVNVLDFIRRHLEEIDVVLFNQDSGIWLFPLRFVRTPRGGNRPRLVMDTRDRDDVRPGDLKTTARLAFSVLNHRLAKYLADGQTTITPRFVDLVHISPQQLWGVWPSGVDPEPFAEAAAARRWPVGDDPIRLVYIGIMLEKRHPVELCHAVMAALERDMSFELYFYGDGPEADLIRQCAAESGGRVKVMPPIAHVDVPRMLAGMHVGVTSLPDADDEKYGASSPIKMFEYMASGLPMLATTNPCHTAVVGDGSFAFWVEEPSGSGILESLGRIWANRASLEQRGLEASQQVDAWTWAAAASKLDRALRYGLEQVRA